MVTRLHGVSVLELPCVQLSTACDPRLQLNRSPMQFAQNVKYEPGHPEDQQAFVDARTPLNRDGDELVDDSPEDRPVHDTNDLETPHSLVEPEFERGNMPPKTRPRSSEELLNDSPIVLRRRVEVPPQQLDLTHGELRADQGASITDHWNRRGAAEPRIELVERQQDRERDEANALIAFYTDRGVDYKYRPKKGGKKSQNINFETSDQFTQAGLTESRKVEWPSGNSLTLCIQHRDPNWNNYWFKDTNRSTPVGRNRQKRAQTARRWSSCCLIVQKSISQPRRSGGNHWCENGLQPVTSKG